MWNLMRADWFRVFRGKGVYVALLIVLVLNGLQVGLMAEFEWMGLAENYFARGDMSPLFSPNSLQNFQNLLLFVVLAVVCRDFDSGSVKNTLSGSLGRVQFYLGKLLVAGGLSTFLFAVHLVSGIGFAILWNGFQGSFDLEWVWSKVLPFLAISFILFAMVSVGTLIGMVARKSAVTIALFWVFIFMPVVVVEALMWATGNPALNRFELMSNLVLLGDFSSLTMGELAIILLIGAGYVMVSTLSGMLLFRKSEIK